MTNQERKKLEAVKGNIYSRETFGTVDGPGVRYVFFLQGCPLSCLYCHNPDSRPFNGGEVWTAGRAVKEVLRYKNFITNGGVTFSGGEPLFQSEFLAAVMILLKEKGIHTTIDTSGCYSLANPMVKKAIDIADLILLDIKSVDSQISKELSGMDSEPAFRLLDYCELVKKPVWIRQVLLEGYTLDEGQLIRLAKRIKNYSCIERIEFLPFHKLGEPKWTETNYEYKLTDTPATSKAKMAWAKEIFKAEGLDVHND